MNGNELEQLTDQELQSKMNACDAVCARMSGTPTVEDIGDRVQRWIASAQADLSRLTSTPGGLETQLEDFGFRLLFLSPTVVAEIESAVVSRVAAGLATREQREERLAELETEKARYSGELVRRRGPAIARGHGPKACLSGATVAAITTEGDSATAKLAVRRNGTVVKETNGASEQLSPRTDWLRPANKAPGRWSARAKLVSGDEPKGSPLNVWQALSTERSWRLSQSGPGRRHAELSIALSLDGGTTIAAEATYSLSAEVAP
jgi:hypothetical protein